MNKYQFNEYHFTFYQETLSSGLKVYFIHKPGIYQKRGQLHFKFGSVIEKYLVDGNEYLIPHGTAHLIEHLLFNLDDGDASVAFEKYGASNNAYTTKTETSFFFETIDNFDECLDLLLKMCLQPHYTVKKLKKERPIVENEIRMYQDDLGTQINCQMLDCLYYHNPFKYEIGGTVDEVRKVNVALLNQIHEHFYHLGNAYLTIVGDFEPVSLFKQIDQLSSQYHKNHPIVKIISEEEPLDIKRPQCIIESNKIKKPLLQVIYKLNLPGIDNFENYRLERSLHLTISYLLGMRSYLTKGLDSRHLLDRSYNYLAYLCNEAQYFGFTMMTSRIDEVIACFKEMISEVLKQPMDEELLGKLKQQMVIEYLQSFDSFSGLCEQIDTFELNQVLFDKAVEIISSINKTDVEKAIKLIDFNNEVIVKVFNK